MGAFIVSRLKAWAAVAVPAIALTLLKTIETQTGFDIPTEWEVGLVSLLTGLFVERIPNIT